MTQPRSIYCLALYPHPDTDASIDREILPRQLQDIGLIGSPFSLGGETRYQPGEGFFQLLSFMGCAPALKLEPDGAGDEKFCHFRIVKKARMELRFLRADIRARCPHCRKPGGPVADIQGLLDRDALYWCCPQCQQDSLLADINWKHEAGLGRLFIELLDVHPHEVVPTDSLLATLSSVTGLQWQYFYTQV